MTNQGISATALPEDYQMIVSLDISNFRGFKHVSLTNLPRINVIIGPSGSGKSAFLEALWVQCGISPEIYFRMRAFRGMAEQQFQLSAEKLAYEAFFSDLFFNPELESGALIQIMDSMLGARHLNISYSGSSQVVMDLSKPQPTSLAIRPLEFRWKLGDTEYNCPLRVVNGQIVVDTPPSPYPAVFFTSSFLASARESAERLSLLNIQGKKEKILTTISKIYKQIKDLSSESISGQQMVWALVEGVPKKLPIALISSGLNKFINILLWVSLTPGGVLIIDEIENGFYFQDYEAVFRTIVEFCDTYQVQLFAATHSWEFLKSVAKVMEKRERNLAMLRTSFSQGECSITQIEGVSSIEAINQDLEIRL